MSEWAEIRVEMERNVVSVQETGEFRLIIAVKFKMMLVVVWIIQILCTQLILNMVSVVCCVFYSGTLCASSVACAGNSNNRSERNTTLNWTWAGTGDRVPRSVVGGRVSHWSLHLWCVHGGSGQVALAGTLQLTWSWCRPGQSNCLV